MDTGRMKEHNSDYHHQLLTEWLWGLLTIFSVVHYSANQFNVSHRTDHAHLAFTTRSICIYLNYVPYLPRLLIVLTHCSYLP